MGIPARQLAWDEMMDVLPDNTVALAARQINISETLRPIAKAVLEIHGEH